MPRISAESHVKPKRPKMLELLFSILRIAAGIYIGICVLMLIAQNRFVYYPVRQVELNPGDLGLVFEDLRIKTVDGETIAGWYVPAEGADRCILFCHGNAGNIGGRAERVGELHRLGFHVLIFDYRGYGDSTGKPSEAGVYRDAQAMWDYLVNDKGQRPGDIIVFGRSLGGGVATWLAIENDPGALVLESAFTSVPDMGVRTYPFLPIRWLCRTRYDNLERIARIDIPKLICHSPQDDIVPYEMGRKLFDAAGEPKSFVELGGGHNISTFDSRDRLDDALVRLAAEMP